MNSSAITTKKPQKPCLKQYHHTKENYQKCKTKHPRNAYQIWESEQMEKRYTNTPEREKKYQDKQEKIRKQKAEKRMKWVKNNLHYKIEKGE